METTFNDCRQCKNEMVCKYKLLYEETIKSFIHSCPPNGDFVNLSIKCQYYESGSKGPDFIKKINYRGN